MSVPCPALSVPLLCLASTVSSFLWLLRLWSLSLPFSFLLLVPFALLSLGKRGRVGRVGGKSDVHGVSRVRPGRSSCRCAGAPQSMCVCPATGMMRTSIVNLLPYTSQTNRKGREPQSNKRIFLLALHVQFWPELNIR